MDNYIGLSTQAVLEHHGIKRMKWGVHKLYDNHKKNLLYQYKKKGLSDKEAQEKLQKRIRNEKIALGTAAAVSAGVAAYYGKNYVQDEFIGRSFKAGKKVDTVTSAKNFDKDRQIYAAFRKKDKLKYRGIYGEHRANSRKMGALWGINDTVKKVQGLNDEDNVVTLMANKKIKVASNRAARKTFKELYNKDKEFRTLSDAITKELRSDPSSSRFRKGSPYELFNVALAAQGKDPELTGHINKFYSALKKKGYSGVLDINDRKFSGYNTKNPTIFFDHTNLKKIASKKLTDEMIKDSNAKLDKIARRAANAKAIGKGAAYGLVGGTIANEATTTLVRKHEEKQNKQKSEGRSR